MRPMTGTQINPMDVRRTDIDGLYVIRMKQVTDERGTVREFYRESAFREAGLPSLGPWVQVNLTETGHGAIRGLHGELLVKLVAVAEGEAFGAYVDARSDSPSRGKVVTVTLTKGTQVLVPAGVCNGFQAVGPGATQYLYCFDAEWVPGMAGVAVNPLDPELAIRWPVAVDPSDAAQLSAKDAGLPRLADLP
jgi:dTDP-4-dehydrorhamnose 3,5-epimerase